MTDVRFYHLQQKRLEQALPEIVAKALERKHRIVVKAGSRERIESLSNALWSADPGSFLAHGFVKDGNEAEQPVWLTEGDDNPNAATVLILTDNASSEKVSDYALCCEIFDGNDDAAVAAARQRWKIYKDQGHTTSYFQQDENGRWQQKQ